MVAQLLFDLRDEQRAATPTVLRSGPVGHFGDYWAEANERPSASPCCKTPWNASLPDVGTSGAASPRDG